MAMSKRTFLKTAGISGAALAGAAAFTGNAAAKKLSNIAKDAQSISVDERKRRIAKAQHLMREAGIGALVLEAGSALVYFTGVRWWRSERFTGAIIPATGDIAVVTPYFEEPSIRETMAVGDDIRTWHENESPFALVAGVLKDRGAASGKLAIEETVRHFIVDGVQKAARGVEIVSGAAITRGCRMYKSAAEIALMQTASDITIAAYKYIHPKIKAGMSAGELSEMMSAATRELGGEVQFSMALLGEASAYPHGTRQPQTVTEGSVILMDCGCSVQDYVSDISRSWVFGEPNEKQRAVWNTVKRGQELALETMQIGVAAGEVDDVVRSFYESEGYGPRYQTPGLSHRLGHGIGMDGHEPVNFVEGEKTKIAPGMCFSNEPGIYIFDEFGIRLEDCLYMNEDGPQLFSALSPSIDKPF